VRFFPVAASSAPVIAVIRGGGAGDQPAVRAEPRLRGARSRVAAQGAASHLTRRGVLGAWHARLLAAEGIETFAELAVSAPTSFNLTCIHHLETSSPNFTCSSCVIFRSGARTGAVKRVCRHGIIAGDPPAA
jgi:hypothetical protein